MAGDDPLTLIEAKPDVHVIEHLQSLLDQARKGELQTIAYVASWKSNSISSGWAGIRNNRMRIMGELFQLLHNLADKE